jgi:hypothetical protein
MHYENELRTATSLDCKRLHTRAKPLQLCAPYDVSDGSKINVRRILKHLPCSAGYDEVSIVDKFVAKRRGGVAYRLSLRK